MAIKNNESTQLSKNVIENEIKTKKGDIHCKILHLSLKKDDVIIIIKSIIIK